MAQRSPLVRSYDWWANSDRRIWVVQAQGADRGKRAAIYLRVSTDEQTTENQERALREVAARSGHEIVAMYRDEGISGSKGRDKRPDFDAMHKDASRRKFDIVMAWSVDRLGRSLQDLCGFLSELHSLGIDLFLHQQGIDTTTPAGKAMFQKWACLLSSSAR
jgi:DNA invertase Pin-like site-specific DNA recombinase